MSSNHNITCLKHLTSWVIDSFRDERRTDNYEEKRFINLISNTNHHFINSFFIDSNNKKIVLNHTIKY